MVFSHVAEVKVKPLTGHCVVHCAGQTFLSVQPGVKDGKYDVIFEEYDGIVTARELKPLRSHTAESTLPPNVPFRKQLQAPNLILPRSAFFHRGLDLDILQYISKPIEPCVPVLKTEVEKQLEIALDLINDYQLFEAEDILKDLIQDGEEVRSSEAFHRTAARSKLFAECSKTLRSNISEPPGFRLVQEDKTPGKEHRFGYTQISSREVLFQVQIMCDAPLEECVCPGNEFDLWENWSVVSLCNPKVYGKRHACSVSTQSITGILRGWYKFEVATKVDRFVKKDRGLFVEAIKTPPAEEIPPQLEPKLKFMPVCGYNWWLPTESSDGRPQTLLVQIAKVDLPVPLPQKVISFMGNNLGKQLLASFQESCRLASSEPVFKERLQADHDGLYAKLREVRDVGRDYLKKINGGRVQPASLPLEILDYGMIT